MGAQPERLRGDDWMDSCFVALVSERQTMVLVSCMNVRGILLAPQSLDILVKYTVIMPVLIQDYPRTWSEFLDWFSSEDACLAYLERLRWPQGFVCPSCGAMSPPSRASRTRLLCRDCRHQSTVTAGTIFDKTRTPLKVWLAAAWYVTNQKQGVSALGLQRVLGLGSYQTAWTMLHRFRRAMVRPDRDRLKGVVEGGDQQEPAGNLLVLLFWWC